MAQSMLSLQPNLQASNEAVQPSKLQNGVARGKALQGDRHAPSALTDSKDGPELGRKLSMPQKGYMGAQVSGLVETDPFAKNDSIRCKAC